MRAVINLRIISSTLLSFTIIVQYDIIISILFCSGSVKEEVKLPIKVGYYV